MHSPIDAIKQSPNTNSPLLGQVPLAYSGYPYPQPAASIASPYAEQFDADALDSAAFDPSLLPPPFQPLQQTTLPDPNPATPNLSTQLVRRQGNNQLATRSPLVPQQQWLSPSQRPARAWEDLAGDTDDINQKAILAKREAQAKRKQIPPFVLKLWSFLNEDKNTDLIRWTDDGTAFTVLDEDEFARTLIPELFKHNNYASFVRQLNMYGFHKKVGLNANSMKAAEKKTKDPNVYWHEYFRQGREDLLWLIQKPQSKSTSTKRKRGLETKEGESDDEKRTSLDNETGRLTKPRDDEGDLVVMPKSEVAALRQEVQKLQRQQTVISQMIGHLKDQNQQFYRQASEFQSLHDRHENSINAILTFLATFYNRSLEAGVDLANMFSGQNTPQQQGSVVDMGDSEQYQNTTQGQDQQLQRYRKPLLLQSSPERRSASAQPGLVSTQPNSRGNSDSPPSVDQDKAQPVKSDPSSRQQSTSPAMKDDDSPTAILNSFPSDNADMMSLINAANASTPQSITSPQLDFSTALNHAQSANGSNPLTTQQRNSMLNLIANQQASHSQPGTTSANNALVTPTPPPMPDLHQYQKHQEQLEMLARMQKEQDSKVQNLAGRIQPLSPHGSIPGLDAENGDFDFDAFLNNPYDGTLGTGGDPVAAAGGATGAENGAAGLDFDFDDGADDLFGDLNGDGPRVESIHSESDGLVGGAAA